jgi:hypothetical protein
VTPVDFSDNSKLIAESAARGIPMEQLAAEMTAEIKGIGPNPLSQEGQPGGEE